MPQQHGTDIKLRLIAAAQLIPALRVGRDRAGQPGRQSGNPRGAGERYQAPVHINGTGRISVDLQDARGSLDGQALQNGGDL